MGFRESEGCSSLPFPSRCLTVYRDLHSVSLSGPTSDMTLHPRDAAFGISPAPCSVLFSASRGQAFSVPQRGDTHAL